MSKFKLPRFPPRKARKTPTLIKFVVRWLDKFQFLSLPIPSRSPFNRKSRLKLLLLAALDRTSISRKARDLREQQVPVPSGEATLAWLKTNTVAEINISQQISFQHFLESLPEIFQHIRRQGMLLAIDFHTDPNYAQDPTDYIRKTKRKASTNQFFQYLTVLWLNAPEPITLGIQLLHRDQSIFEVTQNLLAPLITQERIVGVIADGGFYNWELIKFLTQEKIFFVIRGQANSGVKPLIQKHHKKLLTKSVSVIVDYQMRKHQTRKKIPVKLVFYQEGEHIIVFTIPPTCQLSGEHVYQLYRRRFTIETYYRQMHRFQIFSCSQHPTLRFMLVLLAFWLCNFWAYFKSPLSLLKPTSRRFRADFVYTANDFCEFLLTSWYWGIFQQQEGFSRGVIRSTGSAETLNACGETVRPAYLQARLDEPGRQALIKTGHKRL